MSAICELYNIILNRIGPRTEPCGTPYLSVCRDDVVLRILTELDQPTR